MPIILHLPNTLSRSLDEIRTLASDYSKLRIMLAHAGATWTYPKDFEVIITKTARITGLTLKNTKPTSVFC